MTIPVTPESDAAWNIEDNWPEAAFEDGRLDEWWETMFELMVPVCHEGFASTQIPGRWLDSLVEESEGWNRDLVEGLVDEYELLYAEPHPPGTLRAQINWVPNRGWHVELRVTKRAARPRGLWSCENPEERWTALASLIQTLEVQGIYRYTIDNRSTHA